MPLLSRSSIGMRVPLMLALLLSVSFGVMTAALYREIRETTLEGTSARLGQAARQLAETMALGVRTRAAALGVAARRPEVLDVLRGMESAADAASGPAVAALGRLVGAAPETGIELWDVEGRRLLAAGAALPDLPDEAVREARAGLAAAPDRWISAFRSPGGVLRYSIGVPVPGGGDAVAGYLVERRQLAIPAQSIALLSGLIGDEALLLTGNATGSVWSDLRQAVPAPPLSAIGTGDLVAYERAPAGPVLARIVPVPDAPWMVAVEVPRALVLSPVARMLNRALLLAVVVVGLATAVGWWLSLRLTRPLAQVTAMAEAIAEQRPAERLAWSRRDELGRLATSFNTMADRVEDSRRRYEGLVHDLEARVEARTAELTETNRELEAFTYSVSHDLRAPLRAIDGFARILSDDHGAGLPADATRCLAIIRRNVARMGALIDDLLRLSRVSRQKVSRTALDLTALAHAAAAEVAQSEPYPDGAVVVKALPSATGERELVGQVLVNLIANGVKFSRPRGGAARVVVGSTEQAGTTVYFVRDNGVGFDMKYADKLFGVFQRLHRVEEFDGTGVGLAIVQRIVHRHGGRVWADAAPDQGAAFYFTLPDET